LGNAGRGSGLTLFGDRTGGGGACRVSVRADGDGDDGAGTGTGAGSDTTFAVGSGCGTGSGGASTTAALVTMGVGVGCVVDPLGPGATSKGPGRDTLSTTAPASATMTAITGSGHHRRARGSAATTRSTAGTSVDPPPDVIEQPVGQCDGVGLEPVY
jgi:hypothetical protein